MGRHGGMGHGFGGRFGGGSGRGGRGRGFFGDDGVPAGRKLSSGDLQTIILALLEKAPAHGYELIKSLEELSNGFYSPSPGVIYPALTYLEEIGHASVEQDGNRKRYHATSEGLAALAKNRGEADAILNTLKRIGSRMQQVREAYAGMDSLDSESADSLHQARQALKAALMDARGCTPAQVSQITRILEDAATQIRAVQS